MNLKKGLAAFAVVGIMTFGIGFTADAAGVGVVNFNALIQGHKDTPKADAVMKSEIAKAQKEFNSKKTDAEKQAIGVQLQQRLMEKEQSLLQPIIDDITAKTELVRKEKGLDAVVVTGSVVAGAENVVDITNDVGQKIK